MSDFHSCNILVTGEVIHTPDNSHSGAAARYLARENDQIHIRYVEWEWDGVGDIPDAEKIVRGDMNEAQRKAAQRHALMLWEAVNQARHIYDGGYFAGADYVDVRGAVARNANTPAEALARLSEDAGAWVRLDVAWNSNAPAEVLARLSEDTDAEVRYAAARNASRPGVKGR